ncbi:hypothetical protein Tco_0296821 [Tanacetum coccineum]
MRLFETKAFPLISCGGSDMDHLPVISKKLVSAISLNPWRLKYDGDEKKAGTFKPKTNPNDDEKATFVADENSEGEVLVAYVELGSVLMGDNAHHTKFLRNVVPSHSYNTPVTVESLKVTKALYCDEEEADNKMRGNLYHTSWYYYNSEAGLIEL